MRALQRIAFVAAFVAGLTLAAASAAPPSVTLTSCDRPPTPSIEVTGAWETVQRDGGNGTTTVAAFHGIPYAVQPVGRYRFAASEPLACPAPNATKANGTLFFDAGHSTVVCPQFAKPPFGDFPAVESEACLLTHVYAPPSALEAAANGASGPGLPVFVFIHGGDLTFGSGAQEAVGFWAMNAHGRFGVGGNDDGISAGEAVTVAFNYRLGLLGFLGLPGGGGNVSANFGITDQLAALQWIQRNIRAFGGDPTRVTVVGQSSGATSIFALLAAPRAVGLFRSAIALSGSPNISATLPAKVSQDAPVVEAVGCPPQAGGHAEIECLRGLSWGAIRDATPASWGLDTISELRATRPAAPGLALPAFIAVDGVVLASDLATAMAHGTQPSSDPAWGPYNATALLGGQRRRVLVSHMGQEFNIAPAPEELLWGMQCTDPRWPQYLVDALTPGWGAADAPAIAAKLDGAFEANVTYALLELRTIEADYGVACGYRRHALASAAGSVSAEATAAPPLVYLMANEWQPQLPDDGGWMSFAYHIWDWWCATYQFGNIPASIGPYRPQPEDRDLSSALRSLWFQLNALPPAPPGGDKVPLSFEAGAPVHAIPAGEPVHWRPLSNASQPEALVLGRTDRYPYLGTQTSHAAAWAPRATRCALLEDVGLAAKWNWWCN